MKNVSIDPMVNQIRLCPSDMCDEGVDYCRLNDILLEAYSPLGVGRNFDILEMKALVDKYDNSVIHIRIRWSIQRVPAAA